MSVREERKMGRKERIIVNENGHIGAGKIRDAVKEGRETVGELVH